MVTASKATITTPVERFRPQYEWAHQFSLAQFTVTTQPSPEKKIGPFTTVTYHLTAILHELVPGLHKCDFMDFTITSPTTGTTILFEYAMMAYDGGLVYRPAQKMNYTVPNIDTLRRTVRAILI